MALLGREKFDILFIDIHLGDMEGTALAALAKKLMPKAQIVFATAYCEYAVEAFELGVDNYLLKPFDPRRVREVLELCRQALGPPPRTKAVDKLAVTIGRHTHLIAIRDIIYIDSALTGHGSTIHLSGCEYASPVSLSEYEQRLSGSGFLRIHKTCIVQLQVIRDIFPWSNSGFGLRVEGSQTVLPIGREKIKALRSLLNI